MFYYQFNIGDYLTHTAHLSDTEDLAYRRMLDYCYLHEKHLPDDLDAISRLIRMRGETEAIQAVLTDFFISTDDGWTQNRIQREIKAYQGKRGLAKKAATVRWQDKTLTEDTRLFDLFWAAGMRKVNKGKAFSKFQTILSKQADKAIFTGALIEDVKARLELNQLGFTEMHPTTYLNGARWLDERYKADSGKNTKKSSAVDRVLKKVTTEGND